MLKVLFEGLGTFLLILTIGLTQDPVAAGLLLIALLYIGFSVLEVHYHPAVSFAVWTIGRRDLSDLLTRAAGQFTGSIAGGFCVSWLTSIPFIPRPSQVTGVAEFIFMEILFSALLVLLFLMMIYPPTRRKRSLFGLVIGAGFTACYLVTVPISGFGLHPGLNVGFSIIDFMDGGRNYVHLPIYLLGPFVGAIIAALIHKNLVKNRIDPHSL